MSTQDGHANPVIEEDSDRPIDGRAIAIDKFNIRIPSYYFMNC